MKEKIDVLLNNINGYPLDNEQRKVVTSCEKHLLVSAGAGSGKTLTIIGKIRYLIEIKDIKEEEILCISFTNEATNNLKNKLKDNYNYNITCYTFHKLGLEILKKKKCKISSANYLKYIMNEFFKALIDNESKKRVLSFFKIKYNAFNVNKKYDEIDDKKLLEFCDLIEKFINLFKANDYLPEDFLIFLKSASKREKNFILIAYYIYYLYQKELMSKNEIDFSDMISLATKYVEKNGYYRKIKYVIIDEFQDASKVRFNLIKAILSKTDASLLVVGDDFQSIYRFTGCDLDLFLKFNNIFPDSKILKICNTYRNSKELITVAGSFIMKNKNQLRKELNSFKRVKYPIWIIYYKDMIRSFIKLINYIYNESKKPILVLGRNNFDIDFLKKSNKFIIDKDSVIYKDNKDIKMTYLTVHRSKGLEEENVIVINLCNNKLGFPNKIVDERILRFVSCKKDNYLYAEERRLFYVAITRTKNITYLFTPFSNESMFVMELKKDYRSKIKIVRNDKF